MDTITVDGIDFPIWSIPTPHSVILVIRAGQGMLVCGYLNREAAEKFGDAMAVVTGVKTGDDMLKAEVKAVSSAAARLGVRTGMSGREALRLLN